MLTSREKTRKLSCCLSFHSEYFLFILLLTRMTSSSGRRSSLLPPTSNGDLPNEPMVLASNTLISIKKHNRQRDQQTEAPEKLNDQINQQRHSLAQALDAINTWKKIDQPKTAQNTTPNKSKSVTNYFYKRS